MNAGLVVVQHEILPLTALSPVERVANDPIQFIHYLDPKSDLKALLHVASDDCGVSCSERFDCESFLAPLAAWHLPTYEHCQRVGLLCYRIAKACELSESEVKAALIAGLLHDCGKLEISRELLCKRTEWTDEDRHNISHHVMCGYEMIEDRFPRYADIMVLHHQFQQNRYPEVPKHIHEEYDPKARQLLWKLGFIISLADQYDSRHRIDSYDGINRALTGEEIKEALIRNHPEPGEAGLLNLLYERGVFTTKTYVETLRIDSAHEPVKRRAS